VRLERLIAEAGLRDEGVLIRVVGEQATEVTAVTMDSRSVAPGAMFACVPGRVTDGHDFAPTAVADGAAGLLCERPLDLDVPQVIVSSVRLALGPVCDAFFGHPSHDLTVAAVTGTNGKTTTCAFLSAIFEANGWRSATIGTLTQRRTTPEAPELQALMADWRDLGGRAIAMEVSSHALHQHRTDATKFAAGVFTNLTTEHLDYHRTMEDYFEAKSRLFEPGRVAVAVVNRGDAWGQKLIDRLGKSDSTLETFAADDAVDLRMEPGRSTFRWDGRNVAINLGGSFNVENALAAATCARALGIDAETVVEGLSSVSSVRGRFELVQAGQSFTVVVDFAHTPDALAQVLRAARGFGDGRLIVVFGAGGDRDHEKRPLMGAVASELADLAVVTSDNPRSEDPAVIIEQIVAGAAGRAKMIVEADRSAAIAAALAVARSGDVVVIAGKGHEQGQEAGGRTVPFDDVEVARDALLRIRASRQVLE
jgi:UDP-N-acetylmuramoyl-L-alanyl-D-glutamate--2,6-diaminopimelate ligase